MSGRHIDLTGLRFGGWTVLEFYSGGKNKDARWLCRCDCGGIYVVNGNNLRCGRSLKCKPCSKLKNYGNNYGYVHGGHKEKLYKVWQQMHQRCEVPTSIPYRWYGAKGIKVCEEWQTYPPFRKWAISHGYGPELTIDRFNSKGNYEPSNCRWISRSENTRRALAERWGRGHENRAS